MDNIYSEEFASRLSKLRSIKGVSARDMSLSLGQNPAYINNIETGKALPSMNAFFGICEYLEISPKDFFDTDSKFPDKLNNIIENIRNLDEKEIEALNTITAKMIKQ